jgi:hypothetical protein
MNEPLFFVSYARNDTVYPEFREYLIHFIDDLTALVAGKLGIPIRDHIHLIRFFDESNVETGVQWDTKISDAVRSCKVGVMLYSPSYFASTYCGREVLALLNRRSVNPRGPSGVVPVLWLPCPVLPVPVKSIQYQHIAMPQQYHEVGLRKLLSLNSYRDLYREAREAIADVIVDAIHANALNPLQEFDINSAPSAWEEERIANPDSHKQGSLNKTCFVFISEFGWNWTPYPGSRPTGRDKIGATVQSISGDLGIQYEEIPCNGELLAKLADTRANNVPTLLFADPESVPISPFKDVLKGYDNLYLLNCGAIIPWQPDSQNHVLGSQWNPIRDILKQKLSQPPPNHELRTIYSQDALETTTRATIQNIRLQLLKNILADDAAAETKDANDGVGSQVAGSQERSVTGARKVLRAENPALSRDAATEGIDLDAFPQLPVPTH